MSTTRAFRSASISSTTSSIAAIQELMPYYTGLEETKIAFTAILSPANIVAESGKGKASRDKIRNAIEAMLMSRLLKYDEKMRGVIIGLDSSEKIEFEDSSGRIFNEQPFVLFRVRTTVLLFSPKTGMQLRGVVSNVTSGYIALLVHGSFHVSIDKKNIPSGDFAFEAKQKAWVRKRQAKMEKGLESLPRVIEEGIDISFYFLSFQDAGGHNWSIIGSLAPPNSVSSAKTDNESNDQIEEPKRKRGKHSN